MGVVFPSRGFLRVLWAFFFVLLGLFPLHYERAGDVVVLVSFCGLASWPADFELSVVCMSDLSFFPFRLVFFFFFFFVSSGGVQVR